MNCKEWSGREDLNLRPQRPERCALTRLRYAPPELIIRVKRLFKQGLGKKAAYINEEVRIAVNAPMSR
jgi:hypothetical protein